MHYLHSAWPHPHVFRTNIGNTKIVKTERNLMYRTVFFFFFNSFTSWLTLQHLATGAACKRYIVLVHLQSGFRSFFFFLLFSLVSFHSTLIWLRHITLFVSWNTIFWLSLSTVFFEHFVMFFFPRAFQPLKTMQIHKMPYTICSVILLSDLMAEKIWYCHGFQKMGSRHRRRML